MDGTIGTVVITHEGDNVISVLATYPYTPLLGDVLPDFRNGGFSAAFSMRAQVTMEAI